MSSISVIFNDGLGKSEGKYAVPILGVYEHNDSIVVTSKGDDGGNYDYVITLPDNVSALEIDDAMEQGNIEKIREMLKGTKAFVDGQNHVNVADLPTSRYG